MARHLSGAAAALLLVGGLVVPARQAPVIRPVDQRALRPFAGVYQWGPDAFLYLQMWEEFSGFGTPQLVAFDEAGDVRLLYQTDDDEFFTGPGAAVPDSIESRIAFQRDAGGQIVSLTWQREGAASRTARRVEIEKREDVRFSNRDVNLAGTVVSPTTPGKHPAIVVVHGKARRDDKGNLTVLTDKLFVRQ